MPIPQPRGASLRLVDATAIVLALLLAVATAHTMGEAISTYDEGLLLTYSDLVLRGQVPYRDFYTNYPPGIFLAIAGLWRVFGVHAILERVLGLLIHLTIAVAAARLAGRIVGRRAVPLAAAVTLDCLLPTQTVAFAYLAAVAALLVAIELILCARDGGAAAHRRWFTAGAALGAVGCFRHDLLVFTVLVTLPLAGLLAWRAKLIRDRAVWRAAAILASGALVPLLAVWLPTLIHAGLRQPADDLYFVWVRYVLPARLRPMPDSLELSPLPGRFPTAVALTLAAPLLAGGALGLANRWRLDRVAIVGVGIAGCAVLPQVLGRTDIFHAVYTLAPGVIMVSALVDGLVARWRPVQWAFALLLAVDCVLWMRNPTTRLPTFDPAAVAGRSGPLATHDAEARRQVVDFIATHTRPDDPLFVGCSDHRRVIVNDMDLYFLAGRIGASRTMQLDPGVVTRADVQQTMIGELERTRPPVAILRTEGCWWPEPNRSSEIGASLLDDYLRRRYADALTVRPFRVLTRRTH